MNRSQFLNIPMITLKCYGLHNDSSRWYKLFYRYFMTVLQLICWASVLTEAKLHINDTTRLCETFYFAVLLFQVTFRKAIIMTKGDQYKGFIKDCKKIFLTDGDFTEQQEYEYVTVLKTVLRLYYMMVYFAAGAMFLDFYLATIAGNYFLPFVCYMPDFYGARIMMQVAQMIILLDIANCLLFEGSFLIVLTILIVKYKDLTYSLQKIDFEKMSDKLSLEKLNNLIKDHLFLLSVYRKFRDIYSILFLAVYAISILCLSVQLYSIALKGVSDRASFLRHIFWVCSVLSDVTLVFLSASLLTVAAEDFEQSIYLTNWYMATNMEIRKKCMFLLMGAQMPIEITTANFFPVNRNQLLSIFKVTYTIANTLFLQPARQ